MKADGLRRLRVLKGLRFVVVLAMGTLLVTSTLSSLTAAESESFVVASEPGAAGSATSQSTPRVLIVGDSITFQCRDFVVKNLGEKADVFWLGKMDNKKVNGGDTKRALGNVPNASLEDWLAVDGGNWDIILFNYGLHDVKFAGYKMSNKQVCSPQEYKINLRYIVERLRKTGVRLVWITITPMPGAAEGTRISGDEVVFNEAAFEVLASYPNIAISDLYVSSMAHLDQQDSVHFNKVEGKQRAADLHCEQIDALLEQIASAPESGQKPVRTKAKGRPQETIEQIHNDGTWTDSWWHAYTYGSGQRRASEIARHNHKGQWKNAYRIGWDYDEVGRVAKKTRQRWHQSQWADSQRERFVYSDTGKLKMHLQQERIGAKWVDRRKYEYTFDNHDSPAIRSSYVTVDGRWIKILSREFVYAGGKKVAETLSARIGKDWAPRYRYDYTYGSDGSLAATLSQRHYGGKWIKSAEYRRIGDSGKASLEGWAEGKNEWKEIYAINTVRNDRGLVTNVEYREKLASIGLGDIPLLTQKIEYDESGQVVADEVTVAIKKNGIWQSEPSTRRR